MIPALAHFVWLTPELPWLNVLALHSAALRGGFERVVLHASALSAGARQALGAVPGLELRSVEPRELLAEPRLRRRFAELSSPAAQSNVLRAAILAREGGVYLDMDTVTVRSLEPLRRGAQVFCGLEHVAYPAFVEGQSRVAVQARGLGLSLLRSGLRRTPEGWRHFRRVQHLFPRAANNAVLGAAPGHPFLLGLLERMASLPSSTALRRYALGTHLLQRALRERAARDVVVHEPSAFYPLGPVISGHWFTPGEPEDLRDLLGSETRVVHWYASLRTRRQQQRMTPEFVQRQGSRQLLSRLIRELELHGATKKASPSSVMP
jgi:hypothetical protein